MPGPGVFTIEALECWPLASPGIAKLSETRNWSSGSNSGLFRALGFNAVEPINATVTELDRQDSPEVSAFSSQRHSHLPRSSGMPHSASTTIGNGAS